MCGEDVPAGAWACPSCGADERSGWNEEETRYDGLDLPEDPDEIPAPRRGSSPVVAVVAAVLVVALIAWLVL